MTNNTCPICGANIALVGKSHRCRPGLLSRLTPEQKAKALAVDGFDWPVASWNQSLPKAKATYKYRDPDKWRAYMREFMRKKRRACTPPH